MGDFLLVIIELFSLAGCFRFVTIHVFDRQTDGQNLDRNTVRMLRSRTVKMCAGPVFLDHAVYLLNLLITTNMNNMQYFKMLNA